MRAASGREWPPTSAAGVTGKGSECLGLFVGFGKTRGLVDNARVPHEALPYVVPVEPALFAKRSPAYVMEELHQHNDLEMNFLVTGKVGYLFRGGLFQLPPRQLVVFWGSTPHRIVDIADGAMLMTAQIPAAWPMEWDLPHSFIERFLAGRFIAERNPSRAELDEMLMESWAEDFIEPFAGGRDPHRTALLEMRARIQRLADEELEDLDLGSSGPYSSSASWKRVEQIAHFIAEHYQEPLSVADIADGVGLRPSYVMHLFREKCGVSVMEHILSFRIASAQHLLITTDATIIDIAYESGFGSLSRFYGAFRQRCGVSPARYRKLFRGQSSH